ncbi:MAG: FAD-binding oxidoreductase [Rhodobacteraceae bacterium]|nr:FAD-binding oxidoreductase [Paracoccaceae bacterium]
MSLLHANDEPGQYPESWYAEATPKLPRCAALDGDVTADICVIGGGYTGLSAALHLARMGFSVRLLEAHRVGFGASGRNGGQVGSGQRIGQSALEGMLGKRYARRLWDLGEAAKAKVKALIAEYGIDCDWRDGVANADVTARDAARNLAEARHLAKAYGYDRLEMLDRQGIARETGSDAFAGGVIDWGAGHMNPLAFALGLARAALWSGAVLHEGTEVVGISPGARPVVETSRGSVTAHHVIVACNGYLIGLDRKIARRVMPINNFIVATEPLDRIAPEILPRDIAVADSRFVVNYWRKSPDGRLLFGGGETYGYRFPDDIAAIVRKPLTRIYPQLADIGITHAWGGTLAITRSRLPFFGRPAEGVWTASGYSGHGVALSTLAGEILAQAIAGRPERFDLMDNLPVPPFPGGAHLRSPLLVLAMTWYSLRDRLGL